MKIEKKKKTNSEYFEYLDQNLYLVIHRPDGIKVIEFVLSKLDDSSKKIFQEIVARRTLVEMAKVSARGLSFEKRIELRRVQEEAQVLLDEYIDSVPADIFLEMISTVAYWLVIGEMKHKISTTHTFLASWAHEHVLVEKKHKYSNKKITTKRKLEVVLGGKMDDHEAVKKEAQEDREYKQNSGHIFVNLSHELDMASLTSNSILQIPHEAYKTEDLIVIEQYTRAFVVEGKELSLVEYYEANKENINQEWLNSKDVVKNIITIYTIKLAQNGNVEAFNILMNLYKDTAEHVGVNFIKNKETKYGTQFSQGGKFSYDAGKSQAVYLLSLLLSGDKSERLLKDFEVADKESPEFLNKKPESSLNDTYETTFMLLNAEYEMVKNAYDTFQTNTKDIRSRLKRSSGEARLSYCEKLWRISQPTLVRYCMPSTTPLLLTPINLLQVSPLHNRYLFRPSKKGNLTTWLFGANHTGFSGMIWQMLQDWFKRNTSTEDGKRVIDGKDFQHISFEDDDYDAEDSGLDD